MPSQAEKPSSSSRRVVLKNVRLSYPHLFEPRAAVEGADPKYSTAILVPKDNEMAQTAINEAVKAAIVDGIASKWGGKKPSGLKLPLRDGDELDEFGTFERSGSEYRDCKYFSASSKTKPGVVAGRDRDPALPEDVWPGEYAVVSITFFAYSAAGNRGVSAALNNVWVLGKGERLDGGMAAEDEFASVNVEFGQDEENLLDDIA